MLDMLPNLRYRWTIIASQNTLIFRSWSTGIFEKWTELYSMDGKPRESVLGQFE